MKARFPATRAALEHFDNVDGPACEALCKGKAKAANLAAFTQARKSAADRVRAAFLLEAEALDISSPENVELMSVEKIRRTVNPPLLGRMLALLP